ncbi:MAG: DUF86 domain-containing protein [Armatimonadetes bacterium]|nr:DUF86 domain-containing protein [Armatimonadota bacterium]
MARPDALYLQDILEAADHISDFIRGMDEAAFRASELHRSAVLQKLLVIGEAAVRISEEVKALRPSIPWKEIIGFRNIAVHTYFSVDWSIVWETARREVSGLAKDVQQLAEELKDA